MLARLPEHVRVVDVGPRDGLQNELVQIEIAPEHNITCRNEPNEAGLPMIEATSFVSPSAAPQLTDAAEVMEGIDRRRDICYPVQIPDKPDYERARASCCTAIALFAAARERSIPEDVNATVNETFQRFAPTARTRQDRVEDSGASGNYSRLPVPGSRPSNVRRTYTLSADRYWRT